MIDHMISLAQKTNGEITVLLPGKTPFFYEMILTTY